MIELDWFLPTGGDSRDVLPDTPGGHRRRPDHAYLGQIAQACDQLGLDAVLTPCGTGCEDAWITTATLLPLTQRLKFLVAFRPTLLTPTLAAQMASTYQRMSGGRLLINIVTGAEPAELARFGVWDDNATRYERTGEFIEIMRAAWSGEPADIERTHYRVQGATTREAPDPIPPIYFGGASPEAERVAAEGVDVYLAWGEPPAMVAERIDRMRALAAEAGPELRFVRGGVGTALVGSHDEVAERIVEYHDLGFDAFILSGYPHLEEAYWFGEGVMPILREGGHIPALTTGSTDVFSFR